VKSFRLSTVGSRAFLVAGLQIWNDLPDEMTSAQVTVSFSSAAENLLFMFHIDLII
jgi:hypothetical protein